MLALVARHAPDVAILDIRLPPTFNDEGLRLGAAIRGRNSRVAVLLLSHYREHTFATALLDTSATGVGYLLKDNLANDRMLDDVLHRIANGGTAIDPEVVSALLPGTIRQPIANLTQRERDVLTLMAEGLSDQGVAERLSVAPTTVSTHASNVFRKLGITENPPSNRRVIAVLKKETSPKAVPGRCKDPQTTTDCYHRMGRRTRCTPHPEVAAFDGQDRETAEGSCGAILTVDGPVSGGSKMLHQGGT